MDEIRALIGIYAAIDRALHANPEQASLVSMPLPAYGDGDGERVVGWSEGFEKWAMERFEAEGGDPDSAIPTLEGSLHGLAEITPRCRMRERRLLAIAAAARIFFSLNPDLVRAAALGPEYTRRAEGTSAEALVELFRRTPQASDESVARDIWWQLMRESDEIPLAHRLGPPPCTARLVWVDVKGQSKAAVAVETQFNTTLPFERVKRFATDPRSWKCFPCWCEMDPIDPQPGGAQRYRETVSFDCDDGNMLRLVVDLDFIKDERGDRVVTEYGLSDVQPPGQQLVLVNKGSLVVRQLGPEHGSRVNVRTTKRLMFGGALDRPGFLSIMCYVGYLTFVEDLLCCAAKGEGITVEEYPDVDFPGLPVEEVAQEPRAVRAASASREWSKETIAQLADAATACVDGWANELKESFDKIEAGGYDADALVQYTANMWVRMLRDGARLVDIGLGGSTGAPEARPEHPPRPEAKDL